MESIHFERVRCCCKGNIKYEIEGKHEDEPPNEKACSDESETKVCKNKCYSGCKNTFDIVRVFITEVIIYPILICDIFEVITGRGYRGDSSGDRLGFSLFILSCISLVLYVYIARIVVLAGTIINIKAVRTPNKGMRINDTDHEIRQSALRYQIYFFIHVVLQMLAQILMFVAIGGKVRYDNRHFYVPGNTDESIHVSGFLWYMIVAGYVAPMMGNLTFFIVTYYWTQEFPIGLYVDMHDQPFHDECMWAR